MLKLVFTGNITADPEARNVNTANGMQTMCNFTVAVNNYKGQKETEFYRVSCWNRQAENAMQYLRKGSKVGISASTISARAYKDRNGDARCSMEVPADEIEYLSNKIDGGQEQTQPTPQLIPEVGNDDFMKIPDGLGEELPFN